MELAWIHPTYVKKSKHLAMHPVSIIYIIIIILIYYALGPCFWAGLEVCACVGGAGLITHSHSSS